MRIDSIIIESLLLWARTMCAAEGRDVTGSERPQLVIEVHPSGFKVGKVQAAKITVFYGDRDRTGTTPPFHARYL